MTEQEDQAVKVDQTHGTAEHMTLEIIRICKQTNSDAKNDILLRIWYNEFAKKDGKKIRVSPRQETCMPRPHSPCHGSRLSRPPGEARKMLETTYM